MAMKIRLARGGSKKRPHYSIDAADSRSARDGRFLEKLGTYDPLLAKDNPERVKMDLERVQYWLGEGAQATDRVARFLEAAGVREKAARSNPKSGEPGKAAVARAKERADKTAAAAAVPATPAAAAAAEIEVDTLPEAAADTVTEAAPEAAADTTTEPVADTMPEAVTEAAPEAAADTTAETQPTSAPDASAKTAAG